MALKHDDDLFKESTMSFGEHLEELRRCLFLALIGLILGTLLGLLFGDRVVRLIQAPLERALQNQRYISAVELYKRELAETGRQAPQSAESVEEFMRDEKLVFEDVLVDRAMVQPVDDAGAGEVAEPLNPPPLSRVAPWPYAAADIEAPQAVAEQLLAAASEKDAPALARLRAKLTAEQRVVLQRVATAKPAEGSPTSSTAAIDSTSTNADPQAAPTPANEVARVLNDLIATPDLFTTDAWRALPKNAEVERMLAHDGSLTKEQWGRLNRLTVDATFPKLVSSSSASLITLRLWRPIALDPAVRAKTLNAHEGFMIYMKASLLAGLLLSSPWVFYWLWTFVAAGLYPHEKKYIYVFLPFSLGLFLLGAAIAFLFVFDPVLDFLFSYNRWLGLETDMRISEWLSFVLLLPVGFGVSFQLPLVMLFLERINVFSVKVYIEKWRISILVIAFVAMVLTPADPYSMLLLTIPLTFLYFGGIALCHYLPRKMGR